MYSESADPAGAAEEAAGLPVEREVRPASPIGSFSKTIDILYKTDPCLQK
jgi:hypothetical protein